MNIYRSGIIVNSFPIDENTVFFAELMGADKITAQVILEKPIDLKIGDYIIWEDRNYYINDATEIERNASYSYTINFYGESYLLYNKIVRHLGRTSFNYMGTPTELILLIIDNMRQIDPEWNPGDIVEIEEPINFTIDQKNCRTLLTQVAEEFGVEYFVRDKEIHLVERVGLDTDLSLEYGRKKGLYSFRRKRVDEGFATVWYGYGGSRNLPAGYREGLGRLTFNESPIIVNQDLYGYIEGTVTFEDVFPNRTGSVESTPNEFEVIDTTIDFNLNDLFITDGGAKIVFKSGDLAGNEFPITNYNDTSKTIRFGKVEEDSGYVLPNDVVKAAVGDKYTLVGIEMPESYIITAEEEVRLRTIEHAEKNSNPKYAYDGDLDEKFVRSNNAKPKLIPGNSITMQDDSLGIEELIRIQSIEYPLVIPERIKVVISDKLQYTKIDRIAKDTKKNKREVKTIQSSASYAKLAANEIKNYALLEQFQKTYVGERAVMTGVFVAGNPEDGEVAGISGVESLLNAIRFWAGASFENRNTAPFRVQQDGKAFATAMEILNGCKIGAFNIQDGYIRSADFAAGSPVGVLISDDGISSRNAKASLIPSTSGITIEGSIFGSTNQAPYIPGVFESPISAGVIGIRWAELTTRQLAHTRNSKGVYGGFFSSIKNIGATYFPIRTSGSGASNEEIFEDDNFVIVLGDRTGAVLPPKPDKGWEINIKNSRTVAINIICSGSDRIYTTGNTFVSSFSLSTGLTIKLRYEPVNEAYFMM